MINPNFVVDMEGTYMMNNSTNKQTGSVAVFPGFCFCRNVVIAAIEYSIGS
jgi:hypothetical protein